MLLEKLKKEEKEKEKLQREKDLAELQKFLKMFSVEKDYAKKLINLNMNMQKLKKLDIDSVAEMLEKVGVKATCALKIIKYFEEDGKKANSTE